MRADRLISIVLLLQANGHMTAGALAEHLEVSLRTVHRDLEALSMAGVPVVIGRGRTGGASLLDGYRTDLTGLNESELRVVLALGAGSVASDLGLRGALDSATRKLAVAAGAGRALSLQQRVLIDGDTWARHRVVPEQLARVQDALWSDRHLRLRYRRGEEQLVERVVEPYGLVSKRGTWYLLAGVRGTRRVYRVSRIESAEVLPERFERPPNFELEAAWAESVASYRDRDVLRVRARVQPRAEVRFARVCGDWVVARRPDGVWEVDMPNLEAAAGYIAVFGDEIEVLSPETLRDLLATIGGQLVATYRPAH